MNHLARFVALVLGIGMGMTLLKADPPGSGWTLVFADDFTSGNSGLDARWKSQNGPSTHILCSRWRENALAENGLLRLVVRREERGGQQWTAASLWTRQRFQYGYFECRYRYVPTTGVNNSFWLMTRDYLNAKKPIAQTPGQFEIDINEGKYPNTVATNLHNWSGPHWAMAEKWYKGIDNQARCRVAPDFSAVLKTPVTTSKLRLVSDDYDAFRVMEVKVFPPSSSGYPPALQNNVPNLAARANVTADSVLCAQYPPEKAVDGLLTDDSRWVSAYSDGPHMLTLSWPHPQTIGAVQTVTGWNGQGRWCDVSLNFRFEYWDGTHWRPLSGAVRSAMPPDTKLADADNLGKTFHIYGLEWNEKELIYYVDGREIRRIPNSICHRPAPVWLSLAVVDWGGPVTPDLDGKSMDVDYVKVWQKIVPGDAK